MIRFVKNLEKTEAIYNTEIISKNIIFKKKAVWIYISDGF